MVSVSNSIGTGKNFLFNGLSIYPIGHIFSQTLDQTIVNTTTETSIFGTGIGTLTIPANYMSIGTTIMAYGTAIKSTQVVLPTVLYRAFLNATVIGTTGVQTVLTQLANTVYTIECIIVCRSIGGSGSVICSIALRNNSLLSEPIWIIPPTVTTIDTTIAQTIDLRLTWGTANASNLATFNMMRVEISG